MASPHDTLSAAQLRGLEEQYGTRNYTPLPVVLTRGEGAWVYDVAGKRYLDCLSGYSAVNQGHCHPRILATFMEQAQRLTLTARAFGNDQLPLLCKELAELCRMDKVLPSNTGSEVVDVAIKGCRRWGTRRKGIAADQTEIIVCSDNYHGRTVTGMGLTTQPGPRDDFGPFTPGFVHVPHGDAAALEKAITPRTAAFIVEPIQGEAGILVPPRGYLRAVREVCTRHNVLMVADEIQTGLGRTGALFACWHEDVQPDAFLVAKSLSGGFYPISALVGRKDLLDMFDPGSHGSTFAGNPLACAVARTALQVIQDEKLVDRARDTGAWLLTELRKIKYPALAEVRGQGMFIGLELSRIARPYCERLLERGVLCKDTRDMSIRFTPPLVTSREDLEWCLEQLRAVFST